MYDSYLTFDELPASFKNGIKPYIGTTTPPAEANGLVATLINTLAKQIVSRYEFLNNDFEKFYRGRLPVGGYIQDSYIPRIACKEEPTKDTPAADIAASLLSANPNPPSVGYIALNKSFSYKVTTADDVTKEAFISEESMADFISKQLATPFESLKADRYAVFKNFLQKVIAEVKTANTSYKGDVTITGEFDATAVDAAAQANALKFILSVKNLAASFNEDSTAYNVAGVVTNTRGKRITVFMKSAVKKAVEVLIASGAYNMANVDLSDFDIIEVDNLGDTTGTTVGAIVLCDDAMRWYSSYERQGAFYNPDTGWTNTFLAAKDMLAYARWADIGRISFVKTAG